jgi:hypothetical protein
MEFVFYVECVLYTININSNRTHSDTENEEEAVNGSMPMHNFAWRLETGEPVTLKNIKLFVPNLSVCLSVCMPNREWLTGEPSNSLSAIMNMSPETSSIQGVLVLK